MSPIHKYERPALYLLRELVEEALQKDASALETEDISLGTRSLIEEERLETFAESQRAGAKILIVGIKCLANALGTPHERTITRLIDPELHQSLR